MFPVQKQETIPLQLKPQDTLLALKYWSLRQEGQECSVRDIATSISISIGEISKATKRLITSHIAVERSGKIYTESGALLEWLCFGVRYAYPLEKIGYGRGMPTSWNCPVLKSDIVLPIPAIVWAVPMGELDGILIKPIHKSVPFAASKDQTLYHALSLLEAIRGGKPRELSIARNLLTDIIKGE